jgi:hypothetical protein
VSLRSTFRGHHVHIPSVLTDLVAVLAPFAFLLGLAVLLSYFAPWS